MQQLHNLWALPKMTAKCEPVLTLHGHGRRPYEVLLIGARNPSAAAVPANLVLFSMPPSPHSRKPPLLGTYED